MLKVQFGILWTCPRTREMLNMLNMLKVSPNYEPQGLIARKTQSTKNGKMGDPSFLDGHPQKKQGKTANLEKKGESLFCPPFLRITSIP